MRRQITPHCYRYPRVWAGSANLKGCTFQEKDVAGALCEVWLTNVFEGKTKRLNCSGLFSISQTKKEKKHVPLTRTGTDPFEFHWHRLAADYSLSNCIGLSHHSVARDATAISGLHRTWTMRLGAAAECKQVLLRGSIMELQTLGGTIVEPILLCSHWLLTAVEGEPGRSMAIKRERERSRSAQEFHIILWN